MPLVGGTDEPGLPDNNSNNNKVPLWAVLMSLVYLCKRKLTSVVKPTRQWGPGDPQVTFGDHLVGDWKEGWVVINESLEMDSNFFHNNDLGSMVLPVPVLDLNETSGDLNAMIPQVRRAIYEEQHNIAPGRKHNYSSPNYNTGYDNQVAGLLSSLGGKSPPKSTLSRMMSNLVSNMSD